MLACRNQGETLGEGIRGGVGWKTEGGNDVNLLSIEKKYKLIEVSQRFSKIILLPVTLVWTPACNTQN